MTLFSFAAKAGGSLLLLPFILVSFDAPTIAVWYLYFTIHSLQALCDLGFTAVLTRWIAYSVGGSRKTATGSHILLAQRVYLYVTAVWSLLLISLGTWSVAGPISAMNIGDQPTAWACWALVATASSISIWGGFYSTVLIGCDDVARVRRWEAGFAVISALVCSAVLALDGGLLGLTTCYYGTLALSVIRNRQLARPLVRRHLSSSVATPFRGLWHQAWRTGLGSALSLGTLHGSAIWYAQVASPNMAATIFLCIRLISAVSQLSQAPFYSNLSRIAILYSEGRHERLINLCRERMGAAFVLFISSFILVGMLGDRLLNAVGSTLLFPDRGLWIAFGAAFLAERLSGMYVQIVNATDKIINHIFGSATLAIYLLWLCVLYPIRDAAAIPLALLATQASFGTWYSAKVAYSRLGSAPRLYEAIILLCTAGGFALLLASPGMTS